MQSLVKTEYGFFLGTDMGMFRSTDDGVSWMKITKDSMGMILWDIKDIAQLGDTLVVNTFAGVHLLLNHGTAWQKTTSSPPQQWRRLCVTNGSTIFTNALTGLYRSTDFGTTWEMVIDTSVQHDTIQALAVTPSGKIIAAAQDMLLISSDNGIRWDTLSAPVPRYAIVWKLVANSGAIYVCSNRGLFMSPDEGVTWTNLTPANDSNVTALAVEDTHIIIATKKGSESVQRDTFINSIYLSTDNGASWQRKYSEQPCYNSVCFSTVLLDKPVIVAGGSYGGLIRSTDLGTTWSASNKGIVLSRPECLITLGNTIIAGTTRGLFLSSDDGDTWRTTEDTLMREAFISRFVMCGKRLFARVHQGLVCSDDSGTLWRPLPTPSLPAGCFSHRSKVYYTSGSGQIFLSDDFGATWLALNTIPGNAGPVHSMEFQGNTLFAATSAAGVFRSNDSGASWQPVNKGLPDLEYMPLTMSGRGLVAGSRGPFIFIDDGDNWQPLGTGFPEKIDINRIVTFNGTIFCTITANNWIPGNLFCLSPDDRWVNISENIAEHLIYDIAFNDRYIFIGTYGYGVYRRPLYEVTDVFPPRREAAPVVRDGACISSAPGSAAFSVKVSMSKASTLAISIYTLSGIKIATLFDGRKGPGFHTFNGKSDFLSHGMYLVVIRGEELKMMKKIRVID
ncbi:MAG: hypothetical protein JW863_04375 [Chitinispirillaceae bacterium]|nr:hypothetical protein [Chitinispirillaceae bacterium]